MLALTALCDGWVLLLVAVVWAALVERRDGVRRAHLATSLALVLLADGVAVQALKHLAHLPRPLAVLGPHAVRVLASPLRQLSFPSGHSSAAAALATAAARARGLRRAWPLAVLGALGGVSRVYVGAHWALDVLGGWVLGAMVAAAALALAERAGWGGPERAAVAAAEPGS
ncbi:MAG TPA: phosphatase PAP2 family protein [Anaeromyxobacteraceae bacterium]|nr:phosphatase PAP2 family protein [Anaeromyxobacteraceae bacterium]